MGESKKFKKKGQKMNSFLPKGTEEPEKISRFFNKWALGANKFRAIGDAIIGYEWWAPGDGRKDAHRVKTIDEVPPEFKSGGDDDVKYFWKFPIYDYSTGMIRILHISQKTIREELTDYLNNPDWGDFREYDITVTAKGDGFDRKYTVVPSTKKEVTEEIKLASGLYINMEAFFAGEDPFEEPKKE